VPGDRIVSSQFMWLSSKETQSVVSLPAVFPVRHGVWAWAERIELLLALLLVTCRDYRLSQKPSFRHGIFMLH
jgi:hypothetical protein